MTCLIPSRSEQCTAKLIRNLTTAYLRNEIVSNYSKKNVTVKVRLLLDYVLVTVDAEHYEGFVKPGKKFFRRKCRDIFRAKPFKGHFICESVCDCSTAIRFHV